MASSDLLTLLPHIIVAAAAVCTMLAVAVYRSHRLAVAMTVLGLAAGVIVPVFSSHGGSDQVTPLIVMDAYAHFYIGLILTVGIIVVILSYGYMRECSNAIEEFYVVLLVAALGCMVLVSSSHFISLFLGLELLSVSLYVLIGYLGPQANRIEAGLKYLVTAATSVAFLLFGMALVYMASGTMEFAGIVHGLAARDHTCQRLFQAGAALMIVGFGFKLALAPFHLWAPDVYQGAPTPVTAFIATASKGAVFAVMMRFFMAVRVQEVRPIFLAFGAIAVATMFAGNLLALMQDNLKRLLAYSSIAHLGYLLVAFLAGGTSGVAAVAFYLPVYFAAVLGAFGILTVLSSRQEDFQRIEDCCGLASRHPYLAAMFTVMLFSLIGIPLTAGFMGKFYVLAAGVGQRLWMLVISLVLNSAISLFYYLRIIVAFYTPSAVGPREMPPAAESRLQTRPVSAVAGVTFGILTGFLLWIGVYPVPLIHLVQRVTEGLF
jgi:NADH-quinone oxidoreductase subunit N